MNRIAIIDDDRDSIIDLKNKINNLQDSFNIFEFEDEQLFLQKISNGENFDIVFVDIQLHKINGIDLVKEIHNINENIDIIYYSSDINYVQDIFDTECIYFLVKPIDPERLRAAIDKSHKRHQQEYFTFEYRAKLIKISLVNLIYIESDLKWLNFVYEDKHTEKYYMSFRAIENKLCHTTFLRTHQSFMVNIKFMAQASKTEIILNNQQHIPISRKYSKAVHESIASYIGAY